jgi:hypothetical protein
MLDTAAYLLFLGAGLYGARRGFCELKQAHLSRSWPHTPGVILSSKSWVEKDEEGESRQCLILYFYEVGGLPFRSGRVFWGDALALSFSRNIRQYTAAYPAGKAVKVYYNPVAPGVALLEPGPNPSVYLACLLPLILALWGMFSLLIRLAG